MHDVFRLPAEAARDLLAILKEKNQLQCCHLVLLTHPGVSRLDLSWFNIDLDYFLEFRALDLQSLLHLDLSFSLEITPSAFVSLAGSIPCIQVLHLQSTGCSDSVLSILGASCPNLRDLDLAWCPISDLGLMGFCMDLSCPSSSSPRRRPITRLCITGTMVTVAGAAFALEQLPCLRDLDFPDTFEVLEALHGVDLESRRIEKVPKYNLRVLRSASTGQKGWLQRILTPESFKIATTTCPRTSRVVISNSDTPVEGLLLLSRCCYLTELEIGFGAHNVLAFADVLPLLRVTGYQLTNLSLSEMILIDITAIGTHCPGLLHLSLCDIDGYTPLPAPAPPSSSPSLFAHLESFTLLDSADFSIPAPTLQRVLATSPRLKELLLYWCSTLTDLFLHHLASLNPFSELETVILDSCDLVTHFGVMLLLQGDTGLSKLSLQRCRRVTRNDYCLMLHFARRHNLNVSIEWVD